MSTPLVITSILLMSMPRAPKVRRNECVTVTIRVARRYKNISSFSSQRMAAEFFMAPTALIDSGHRSRSSKTQGRRLSPPTIQAAQAVKNCGDVPTTTSTWRTNRLASVAANMKLM